MMLNYDITFADPFGIGSFMKDLRKYLSKKERVSRVLLRLPESLHLELDSVKRQIGAKSMNETIVAACRLFTESAKKHKK